MTTGKDKADFPGAFIPFDIAVGPVPTVPIDSAPVVQLCVNEDWLPFIIGSLKAIARPETWNDSYDNAVIAASEFAALIGSIADGCGVVVPTIMCASGTFEDSDYGFVATPGAECAATWESGVGWQMCADATPQGFLEIKREFGTVTLIREVHLKLDTIAPYLIDIDITLFHDTTFTNIYHATAVTGPTIAIDVTGLAEPATAMFITIVETLGGSAADTIITDWKICYTGAFPLSVTPAETSFTHTFDFTADDGGFADWVATSWVSGQGWVGSRTSAYDYADHIRRLGFSPRVVTHISFDGYLDTCTGANCKHRIEGLLGGSSIFDGDFDSVAGLTTWSWDGFAYIDGIGLANNGGDTATSAIISRCVVSGIGADPF